MSPASITQTIATVRQPLSMGQATSVRVRTGKTNMCLANVRSRASPPLMPKAAINAKFIHRHETPKNQPTAGTCSLLKEIVQCVGSRWVSVTARKRNAAAAARPQRNRHAICQRMARAGAYIGLDLLELGRQSADLG